MTIKNILSKTNLFNLCYQTLMLTIAKNEIINNINKKNILDTKDPVSFQDITLNDSKFRGAS